MHTNSIAKLLYVLQSISGMGKLQLSSSVDLFCLLTIQFQFIFLPKRSGIQSPVKLFRIYLQTSCNHQECSVPRCEKVRQFLMRGISMTIHFLCSLHPPFYPPPRRAFVEDVAQVSKSVRCINAVMCLYHDEFVFCPVLNKFQYLLFFFQGCKEFSSICIHITFRLN